MIRMIGMQGRDDEIVLIFFRQFESQSKNAITLMSNKKLTNNNLIDFRDSFRNIKKAFRL